ncbi:MAG: BrnT family toxin [Selenomonadaceae bacterium]|nr:BrnT family toxin [Selenomonadaceae bacterium]
MSDVERIINNQLFEWDSNKAVLNRQKHGITFETAALVFADDNRIERYDSSHSDNEDRYITIGRIREVLFVVYTERLDKTRLISARRATAEERRDYYVGNEGY